MNSYLRQKHTVNTVTTGFYEPLKKLTSRIQVKVTTKSKNGRKIIQEERLIPVFIDEKDKILYCYNEVIKMYGDVFSEHVVTLCDYSGKETIVKHIHHFNPAQ